MEKEPKKIVWLASYPKSGNTWFRIFLSNLLSDEEGPVSINQLHATPIASSRSLFDSNSGVASSDLTPEEIEELRPEVYRQAASDSDELLFLKVHDAWKCAPSGKPLFPEEITKAAIYFIRNPLDVAVSFAFHNSKTFVDMVSDMNDPAYELCPKSKKMYSQLKQQLTSWSAHVESWIVESQLPVLVIRYEDMLTDSFTEFCNALEFIGINKSEMEIRQAIKHSNFETMVDFETKEGFKEKPIQMKTFFRSGKSGDWREHLGTELVNRIIDQNRTIMQRFEYL